MRAAKNEPEVQLMQADNAATEPAAPPEHAPAEPEAAGAQSIPVEEQDPTAILKTELASEHRQRLAAEERALRWRADLENLHRRTMLEAEQTRINLTQDILERFLPILDDLDRALVSAGAGAPPSWTEGLAMAQRRFMSVLAEQGLVRMDAVGQAFDPEKHEAMARVEDSGQPANTVVDELRPGYALCGRVIRPALVKVQG